MRLIDADVLMDMLRDERDLIDIIFVDEPKIAWQRKNEIVRVMSIVGSVSTERFPRRTDNG